MTLSYAELEGYWIAAGGNKAVAPIMAAIGMAESGGDPNAINPNDNNGRQTSWGVWQISDGTHNEVSPTWNDPLTNAKLAVAKYNNPQGLNNWGTYTSNAYKKFLQSGTPPQNPSPVNSTGGVQQAGLTTDIGAAVADGILQGFAGALGPVLKWSLWFAETVLGLVVMGAGVFLAMQASSNVREAEKKSLSSVPAGRVASPAMRTAAPRKAVAAKAKPEVNPYSGGKVRNPERERQLSETRKNAAAARRVNKARIADANKRAKDPRNAYRK